MLKSILKRVIAAACQTNRRGARFEHAVKFIRSLGFEVTHLKDGGLHDLFDYLAANQPVIARNTCRMPATEPLTPSWYVAWKETT